MMATAPSAGGHNNKMGHDASNNDDEETVIRKSLALLDTQRKALESELEAITSELTTEPSPGVPPMGIDTPLIDGDGYPRGDVDVYRARALRGRLAVIKTDHRNNMRDVEGLLFQLAAVKNPRRHQEEKEEYVARTTPKPLPKFDPVTGKWVVMNWDGTMAGVPDGDKRAFHESSTPGTHTPPPPKHVPIAAHNARAARQLSGLTESPGGSMDSLSDLGAGEIDDDDDHPPPRRHHFSGKPEPFARVDAVAESSPARSAGLLEDDLIVKFGSINVSNHNHLRAIVGIVPEVAATRRSIPVTVVRRHTTTDDQGSTVTREETTTLDLFPKPWDGRGLIGCHIVPYTG